MLTDLIKLGGAHARTVLIDLGQDLAPTWVLIKGQRKIQIVATPWKDDRDKVAYRQAMRAHMALNHVLAYSFVTEAWTAHLEPGEWTNPLGVVRPSERADRQEVVIVCAATETRAKWGQWSIERNERGKVTELVDRPWLAESDHQPEGWLAEMLK